MLQSKSWSKICPFCVKNWSQSCVKNWSKCFRIFIVFLGMFQNTNSVTLCQNSVFFCKIVGISKRGFRKENCIFCFLSFCLFYVGEIETEKRKKNKQNGKRSQNPIKIVFFEVVIHRCEKSKNGFLAKLPDTICVRKGEKRAFSCTLSVLAKNLFWTKTVQIRKHYKNSGFGRNCPKPKMTPFSEKGVF